MNKEFYKKAPEGKIRTLQILLDPWQYKLDLELETESTKIAELYGDFHVIMRRRPKTNTFKSVLETLNELRKNKSCLGLSK